MKSINRQLLLNLVIGSQILFLIWATAFFFYTRHLFSQQFDEALAEKIRTFADLCEVRRDHDIALRFLQLPSPEFQPSPEAMYFQLLDRHGQFMARSDSLGNGSLPTSQASEGVPVFEDIMLPDGRQGRSATLLFVARPDDTGPPPDYNPENPAYRLQFTMARPRKTLDDAQSILFRGFLLFGLALPLGAIWVTRRAVQHGLRPLHRMASQLAEIEASDLTIRVEEKTVPAELLPMVKRLNELLARLDTAFRRERRLTADIAHELRTPIAELRVLAELMLRRISSTESHTELIDSLKDVLAITQQMERQVHTLLELARCESGAIEISTEDIDFLKLLHETAESHQAQLRERNIDVEFRLPDRASVRTSPKILSTILGNLFSNAARYTDDQGSILCEVQVGKDRAHFYLSNTTTSLEESDLEHLCEPFWRKQTSRSDAAHSGLGLTLVKSYSELLGLDLKLSITKSGWLMASLSLPCAKGQLDIRFPASPSEYGTLV